MGPGSDAQLGGEVIPHLHRLDGEGELADEVRGVTAVDRQVEDHLLHRLGSPSTHPGVSGSRRSTVTSGPTIRSSTECKPPHGLDQVEDHEVVHGPAGETEELPGQCRRPVDRCLDVAEGLAAGGVGQRALKDSRVADHHREAG